MLTRFFLVTDPRVVGCTIFFLQKQGNRMTDYLLLFYYAMDVHRGISDVLVLFFSFADLF